MLQVLVADDEYYVRKSINALVNWKELDLAVTAEAEDGLEACEILQNQKIDILITDIRMPNTDGLELIRLAKGFNSNMEFIIISGFDDFSYAREAIKLGVSNYLCKPVDIDELTETLKKLHDKLQKTEHTKEAANKPYETIDEHFSYIHMQQSLQRLISFGQIDSLPTTFYTSKAYGVICLGCNALLEEEKIENWLCQITDIYHNSGQFYLPMQAALISQSPLKICFVVKCTDAENADCLAIGNSLCLRFYERFHVQAICGCSAKVVASENLKAEWERADNALKSRIFLKKQIISTAEITQASAQEIADVMQTIQKFTDALSTGNSKEAHIHLLMLFSDEIQQINTMEILLNSLINTITGYQMRYHLPAEQLKMQLLPDHLLLQYDSMEKLRMEIVPRIMDFFFHNQYYQKEHIVNSIRNYIRNHSESDLRLNTLSERFYLSPNYLSFLFKKETGYAISEYIEFVRMERAKALLIAGDDSIGDIALKIGYQNAAYFSRAFKKLTGLSPAQYQKAFKTIQKV